MADQRSVPDRITRREFATRVGAAAAGMAVGTELLASGLEPSATRQRPHPRRQRSRRDRQHRHPRPGQRAEARFRTAAERRDQDPVRHRREPGAASGFTTNGWPMSPLSSRVSRRTSAASSTTRTSTPSSSRRRTTGTRWPPSGRCRPASTSTSRSPRRTPCGKGARWSRRRRDTTRSCRSAR